MDTFGFAVVAAGIVLFGLALPMVLLSASLAGAGHAVDGDRTGCSSG